MIGLLIFSSIASGILGGYIAKQKNRSLSEGAIIGFLFSVIGVLVVALLPTNDEPKTNNSFTSPSIPLSNYKGSQRDYPYLGCLIPFIILAILLTIVYLAY